MEPSCPESIALKAALDQLNSLIEANNATVREARIVSRAADDLEITALESSPSTKRALLQTVTSARAAVQIARKQAHENASQRTATERAELFAEAAPIDRNAAEVAREINESLRRTTAIVGEEIARSQAAGQVVDASSRRLRQTKTQHGKFGDSVASGAGTLADLKRSQIMANVVVALCFFAFFAAAGVVTYRRISHSGTARFLVRPAGSIIFAPVRGAVNVVGYFVSSRQDTTTASSELQSAIQSEMESSASAEIPTREKESTVMEEVMSGPAAPEGAEAGPGVEIGCIRESPLRHFTELTVMEEVMSGPAAPEGAETEPGVEIWCIRESPLRHFTTQVTN